MHNNCITLKHMKTDWYEKGPDIVNVHLYVKDCEEHEIIFEEDQVIAKFSTKHPSFLKVHAPGNEEKAAFCYVIRTRGDIDCAGSSYNVKKPFIEIFIKKRVPIKWSSLEQFGLSAKAINSDVVQPAVQKNVSLQLLGGKSTPKIKKSNDQQDSEVRTENQASCSKTEDKRNIQKTVTLQPEPLAGLTGLENYANNCYMNVVIQILTNIQETRDYFKNDHYIKDINSSNPLSSGGKVAKAFADVTKALWSYGKNAFKPLALKNVMGKQCSLFLGWQQHDAQEFFGSLLDNLHEDLNQFYYDNTVEKEVSKLDLESSVNEKPETAWNAHFKRNNSFIAKLFHGQLMSKLTCAACHKMSYSYDPCAQISLPIPSAKQILKVLFFTRDVGSPPKMITLQISTPNAQVWHLINMLQTAIKIPAHLTTLFNGLNGICLDDQAPLMSVRQHKYIIAAEIAARDEVDCISLPVFQYLRYPKKVVNCDYCFKSQNELPAKLKRCTRCMAVAYCSRDCQAKHWQKHGKLCSKELKMQVGLPFFVTLQKDLLTFEKLEDRLRHRARFSTECSNAKTKAEPENKTEADNKTTVDNKVPSENSLTDSENRHKSVISTLNCRFSIKLCSKVNICDETCVLLFHEHFSTEAISKAASIVMEWQNSPATDVDQMNDIRTKEVPIYEVFADECESNEEEQCSLYDCLKLFMEPERLDESESWKCPKCKSLQSAKKEMAISYPPCLLLLHLKRFTYGEYGQKINKAVSYLSSILDLTPFIAKETRNRIEYPLLYDLCGVITHRGFMRMGHYTCMVRLLDQLDREEVGWRLFDDDHVSKIKSDKACSPDAYVLIYRLRGTHEIMKLDRCPSLTASASSLTVNVTPNVKRKRADHALDSEKRRSASEYTLNRIKRSISAESEDCENKDSEQSSSSPIQLRRCASAVPIEYSDKFKKDHSSNIQRMASLPDVAKSTKPKSVFDKKTSLVSSSSDEYMHTKSIGDSPSDSIDDVSLADNAQVCFGSYDNVSIDEELSKTFENISLVDSSELLGKDFVNVEEADVKEFVYEHNHFQKDVANVNENDLD